jgi:hypothetical protein
LKYEVEVLIAWLKDSVNNASSSVWSLCTSACSSRCILSLHICWLSLNIHLQASCFIDKVITTLCPNSPCSWGGGDSVGWFHHVSVLQPWCVLSLTGSIY